MKEFSVLSLNLRFGLANDGPNGWKHRKESVAKFFQQQDPDFIATQEANHFQVDFLARNLSKYEYVGQRTPAPDFWQDNVLFYKKTIICVHNVRFFLSQTPYIPSRSFGGRFPRQATMGLFHINEKPLVCIATHLDFDTPAQMGAVRVINGQLKSYEADIPVILMGDFNSTPESPCYRWLTADNTDKEPGFQETFKAPHPSTFHHFTGKPIAGYIDWILYRGPLKLKACKVLEESVDNVYLSDHYPVKAVFEHDRV